MIEMAKMRSFFTRALSKWEPHHFVILCGCVCFFVIVASWVPLRWPPARVVEISRTEQVGDLYAVIVCERNPHSFNLELLDDLLICGPAYKVVLELRYHDKPSGTFQSQDLGYFNDDFAAEKGRAPQAKIDPDNQRVILTYEGGWTRSVPILPRGYFVPDETKGESYY